MELKTKYNLGDTVVWIHQAWRTIWTPCEFCGETGTIEGKNGEKRICPECYGRMVGDPNRGPHEWLIKDGPLTLGQVTIRFRAKRETYDDSIFYNYGCQTEFTEETYMAYESGIGSGACYNADHLFPTTEAAQAECDRRNAIDKETPDA